MNMSYKKGIEKDLLVDLLSAHKKMTSAEKVDVIGVIKLTRYILRLLNQMDDEIIQTQDESSLKVILDNLTQRDDVSAQLQSFINTEKRFLRISMWVNESDCPSQLL